MVRMSLDKAVIHSQSTSLQNKTQSIKDTNFAGANKYCQNPGKIVSRFKALAATYNFTEVDTEVKSQDLSGCIS